MSRVLAPGEEECEQRVGEKSLLLETQCREDEGEDGAAAVLLGLEGRAPEERDGRADGGEGGQGLEGGDEGVCVVQAGTGPDFVGRHAEGEEEGGEEGEIGRGIEEVDRLHEVELHVPNLDSARRGTVRLKEEGESDHEGGMGHLELGLGIIELGQGDIAVLVVVEEHTVVIDARIVVLVLMAPKHNHMNEKGHIGDEPNLELDRVCVKQHDFFFLGGCQIWAAAGSEPAEERVGDAATVVDDVLRVAPDHLGEVWKNTPHHHPMHGLHHARDVCVR